MLFRHTAIYFLGRGVPGLIGFLTIVLFTRYLEPEEFGYYTLVTSGALFVASIAYQWITASVLRFSAQSGRERIDLLVSALSAYIGVSGVVVLLGFAAFLSLIHKAWNEFLLAGILLVLTQAWFSLTTELLRGELLPKKYGVASIVKAVGSLAFAVPLIWLGLGAHGAILGLVLGYSVGAFYAGKGQWKGVWWSKPRRQVLGEFASYGLPLTFSLALSIIVSSTDRYMIAFLIGAPEAGLFAAGHGLAQQSIGVLMAMVHLAGYPLAVKAYETLGREAAQKIIGTMFILLVASGAIVAMWFILLPEQIANMLLGKSFATAAVQLMPWVATATIISSVRTYYTDIPFYLSKRTNIHAVMIMGIAVINVVLNFVFIPEYGIVGAVYASIIAHTSALILSLFFANGLLRFVVPYLDFLKLALALLGGGVLVVVLERMSLSTPIFSMVLSGLLYVFLMLIFDVAKVRSHAIGYLRRGAAA